MAKTAVMFGSIGSILETSDIQRRAYNQALREAGLSWSWDPETYADLLMQAGGRERLSQLSAATSAALSPEQIASIHRRKTEIACAEVIANHVAPRPGVIALLKLGKARGMKLGFVTTTYQPNIDAVFAATDDGLAKSDFDVIVSRDDVARGKPAPDAYHVALRALSVAPGEVLAIEDTANSVAAAKRAGIQVVATPGAITAGQDFWLADLVVGALANADGRLEPQVAALLD